MCHARKGPIRDHDIRGVRIRVVVVGYWHGEKGEGVLALGSLESGVWELWHGGCGLWV